MVTPTQTVQVDQWPFPLIQVTEDKRTSRVGVHTGAAHELVGVDGSLHGGLRPLSGFEKVRELDFYADPKHDETSRITANGFFPVDFRAGSEDYGYGFVYRAERAVGASSSSGEEGAADVFIDYWLSSDQTWHSGVKIVDGCSPTAPMDVAVIGRFVFVVIEGRTPALFFLAGTSAPFTETVLGQTVDGPAPGPGKQPTLISPEKVVGFGEVGIPADTDRPAAGQIVLTQVKASLTGLFNVLPSSSSEGIPELTSSSSASSPLGPAPAAVHEAFGDDVNQVFTEPFEVLDGDILVVFTAQRHTVEPPWIPYLYWEGDPGTRMTQLNRVVAINGGAISVHTRKITSANAGTFRVRCDMLQAVESTAIVVYVVSGASDVVHSDAVYQPNTGTPFVILNALYFKPLFIQATWTLGYTNEHQAEAPFTRQTHSILNGNRMSSQWDMKENPQIRAVRTIIEEALGQEDSMVAGAVLVAVPEGGTPGQPGSPLPAEDPQDETARMLAPGDYTFAVQLRNSQTGRRSALSEVAQVTQSEFPKAPDPPLESGEEGGVKIIIHQPQSSRFAALEMVYDSAKFDQAYVYRSVRTQSAGGTFIAGIQMLDNIIDLAEYHTNLNGAGGDFDPGVTSFRHIYYYYQKEDKVLTYQPVYLESPKYDEQMPHGGVAGVYENALLVSRVKGAVASTVDENRNDDVKVSIGELRWSSLVDVSPELFPPGNRYVPRVPSNVVERFLQVGNSMLGFSLDRMYHVHREGLYIKVQEIHEGFGIANRRATDAAGSLGYLVTTKGLKAITADGQLDDVSGLDYLLQYQWRTLLGGVSMAFDPQASVLFVYNSLEERAVSLWFNTGMVTEVEDLPFLEVRGGAWPSDPSDPASTLTKRALWVQNISADDPTEVVTGMKPRVYILDYERRKMEGGDPRLTTLDFGGISRGTVYQVSPGTNQISFLEAMTGATADLNGAYVYLMEAASQANIGLKAKIKTVIAGVLTLVDGAETDTFLAAAQPGDRMAVSPVPVRWVGHPVSSGVEGDFFTIRQVDGVGASFTDVSGPPSTDGTKDAKYRGLVYRGSEVAALGKAFPLTSEGVLAASIRNGEPLYYAGFGADTSTLLLGGRYGLQANALTPGVEVVCPDLDFRLVQAIAAGKIQGSALSLREGVS